jgi:hypothetical protein
LANRRRTFPASIARLQRAADVRRRSQIRHEPALALRLRTGRRDTTDGRPPAGAGRSMGPGTAHPGVFGLDRAGRRT